jgi:hypothetical protein
VIRGAGGGQATAVSSARLEEPVTNYLRARVADKNGSVIITKCREAKRLAPELISPNLVSSYGKVIRRERLAPSSGPFNTPKSWILY